MASPSFFSFHGRIRRKTYVFRVLGIAIPCAFIDTALQGSGDPGAIALGSLIVLVGGLSLLPSAVQRLHDFDRSGHWMWLSFVPLLNLMLGLALLFTSGSTGSNSYGANPRRSEQAPLQPEPPIGAKEKPSQKHSPSQKSPTSRSGSSPRGIGDGKKAAGSTKDKSTDPIKITEPKTPIKKRPEPGPVPGGSEDTNGEKHVNTKTPSDGESPPPPRIPTKQAPCIKYDPFRLESQRKVYPKLLVPRPNSPVQRPRHGKSGREGYKEDAFRGYLSRHFGERFHVGSDHVLAVASQTSSYEPDFVLHDPQINLYLDVEIDEPYNGYTRRPAHCIGNDDFRDDCFVRRGWIVVRFPEILVHRYPDACCGFLAELLSTICPDYSVPEALRQTRELPRVKPWDELQAQKWATEKYREKYLGIDSFGSREGGPTTFIEELTESEEAVVALSNSGDPPVHTNGSYGKGGAQNGSGVRPEKANEPATGPVAAGDEQVAEGVPNQNTHPRDANIEFDPGEHRYFINGNPDTISVTTLIERCFPIFDPIAVAQKVSKKPTSSYYGREVEDIVAGWKEKGERAAKAGKRLHKLIEKHLGGIPIRNGNLEKELSYFRQFLKDHPELEPYRTEWRIYDEYLMVAGTLDALFKRKDGALVMYDWKRTKNLRKENRWEAGFGALSHLPNANYYKYALQQNIYREILRRHYDLEVNEMNLLVLHPSNDGYERHAIDVMEEETRYVMEQ